MSLARVLILVAYCFAEVEPEIDRRIYGGVPIKIDESPWTVVYGTNSETMSVRCAGSILSDKWVITAAHCGKQPFIMYKTTTLNIQDGDIIMVESYYIHEKFNATTWDWDFQLLRLDAKIIFDDKAQPITIGDDDYLIDDGNVLTVVGWGKLSSKGLYPSTLMSVDIPIKNIDECKKVLDSDGDRLTNRTFCAGNDARETDTCHADGGGPAVINELLVGIVSWRLKCGKPKSPTVFAKVSAAKAWIVRVTRRRSMFSSSKDRQGKRCICPTTDARKREGKKYKKKKRTSKERKGH